MNNQDSFLRNMRANNNIPPIASQQNPLFPFQTPQGRLNPQQQAMLQMMQMQNPVFRPQGMMGNGMMNMANMGNNILNLPVGSNPSSSLPTAHGTPSLGSTPLMSNALLNNKMLNLAEAKNTIDILNSELKKLDDQLAFPNMDPIERQKLENSKRKMMGELAQFKSGISALARSQPIINSSNQAQLQQMASRMNPNARMPQSRQMTNTMSMLGLNPEMMRHQSGDMNQQADQQTSLPSKLYVSNIQSKQIGMPTGQSMFHTAPQFVSKIFNDIPSHGLQRQHIPGKVTFPANLFHQNMIHKGSKPPKPDSNIFPGIEEKLLSSNRSKRKIEQLIHELDSDKSLDPNSEKVILSICDDFIDQLIQSSCKLAKHRHSNSLEVQDIQLTLDKYWNMGFPGFVGSESKHNRKNQPTPSYQNKSAAVKKSKLDSNVFHKFSPVK